MRLDIQAHGNTLHARIHAGPYQAFGAALALLIEALLDRVEQDPDIRAVVFSSAHASRFISHADVKWLQEGGAQYVARQQATTPPPAPPADYVGLDRLHGLLLRMNSLGVVFIAALEGHALGLGAEFAWACDLRVMASEDAFIGQPEVLLGIMPGGGGSQRLSRLVGTHKALVAILDGRPLTSAQALEVGAVDAVVPKADVVAKALALADYSGAATQAEHRRHQARGLLRQLPALAGRHQAGSQRVPDPGCFAGRTEPDAGVPGRHDIARRSSALRGRSVRNSARGRPDVGFIRLRNGTSPQAKRPSRRRRPPISTPSGRP
ncbi:MAG: enoyl-CoA hydratase/isomerase family protein [Pseudoxanthomonas sp.]